MHSLELHALVSAVHSSLKLIRVKKPTARHSIMNSLPFRLMLFICGSLVHQPVSAWWRIKNWRVEGKGRVTCNGQPMPHVSIWLMDDDPLFDDKMGSTRSDSRGNYASQNYKTFLIYSAKIPKLFFKDMSTVLNSCSLCAILFLFICRSSLQYILLIVSHSLHVPVPFTVFRFAFTYHMCYQFFYDLEALR